MVVAMWWMLVKGHTGDVNMAILTPNLLGFAFVKKIKSPLRGGKKTFVDVFDKDELKSN
jgi:hypothetical protein